MNSSIGKRILGGVLLFVPPYITFLNYVGFVSHIEGQSMEPTFNQGDLIIVSRISKPKKGDVVIVGSVDDYKKLLIKRLIGVEGDIINTITKNNYSLSTGHCWLEGDNPKRSRDSRQFGEVPMGLIKGVAKFRIWPFKKAGRVTPRYLKRKTYFQYPLPHDKMDVNHIAVDLGSYMTKAGICGEKTPEKRFLSLVSPYEEGNKHYIGKAARKREASCIITEPISEKKICDWNGVQHMLEYLYSEDCLDCPSEESLFLTSESPLVSKTQRETLAQLLFETLNTYGMFIADQGQLALYASGVTTGVVVDAGHDITVVAPYRESRCETRCVYEVPVGGRQITKRLASLLSESKKYPLPSKPTRKHYNHVANIKKQLCYIINDVDNTASVDAKAHSLPDGKIITLKQEMFDSPEVLFNPTLMGIETATFPELLYMSVNNSTPEVRKGLFEHIVLTGGTSMFKGIIPRLMQELKSIVPSTVKLEIIAPKDRNFSVWRGASVLGSLSSFNDFWVTTEEYNEYGPFYVHKKTVF